MTLARDLNRAHRERVDRIYAAGLRPRPIEIKVRERQVKQSVRVNHIVAITPDEWPAYEAPPIIPLSNLKKLEKIRSEVAAKHYLTENEMMSHSRNQALCAARAEFCYRAVTETTASLPRIAHLIEREHSTVINATASYCNKHNLPFPRGAQWPKWRKEAPNV